MIVNNDEEGAGHTEKAGADEDDHRHQQHEHEVGVGGLQSPERKYLVFYSVLPISLVAFNCGLSISLGANRVISHCP